MPPDEGVIIALTGASGARYGLRTLQVLAEMEIPTHVVVSDAARQVAAVEEGIELDETGTGFAGWVPDGAPVTRYQPRHVGAAIASGSFPVRGMAVVPCSTGSLGRIANGISSNLVERAADVCLKERRPLVLVPRETPLSLVHLRNLTALAEAGARIVPAMPGFYHRPAAIDDLIDFVVARVLDQLGIAHPLGKRWEG